MNIESNDDLEIVNPEKIKPIRRSAKIQFDDEPIEDIKIKDIENYKSNYNNYGSTVKIDLESNGRFGNPKTIYLKDYTARHINDLATCKEDDLLETLMSILNDCVVEPSGFDVGNLTNEEFYEVIVGMKMAFDSPVLRHKWVHEESYCQGNKEDEDKKISESLIDLRDIKSKSIEESDEKIKEFYREKFNNISKEEFKEYLMVKYGEEKNISIEEEVQSIKIQEPFLIQGYETDYEFNIIRMKNLLLSYKIASKEFNNKIRIVQNKTLKRGENEEISRVERQEEIEKLKRQKAKKVLEYAQAFSLHCVRRNGKRVLLKSNDEKLKEYNDMPRNVLLNYLNAVDSIRYGVDDEIHLHCNLCDSTERGYLQRLISPFHLLPVNSSERNTTTGDIRNNTRFNFYF